MPTLFLFQAEAYKTLARKVITFLKMREVPENKT
jgi:hypothetical protein